MLALDSMTQLFKEHKPSGHDIQKTKINKFFKKAVMTVTANKTNPKETGKTSSCPGSSP